MHFTYDNCNDAWPQTVKLIQRAGVEEPSRNGRVMALLDPVTFTYNRPQERVLFCEKRNINPYLHFFEPLWILAGRRDVGFLSNIVSRFREYSDDGKVFNAAYGYRLRGQDDQVTRAIQRLKRNPNDRQVVLQIRHPDDIWYEGKDTACNLCVAVSIRNERLNIHVFNRSNDVVWGGPAGGANFPQFTVLQEYLAGHIGVGVGKYHHTTNNMHAYVDTPDWARVADVQYVSNPYQTSQINFHPLFEGAADPKDFDADLLDFFYHYDIERPEAPDYRTPFFKNVVTPMWRSFLMYKSGLPHCYVRVGADDWDIALKNWLSRKNKA